MTLFSVLDQVPMRAGGEPGHAFRDAVTLAQAAERLGFHRHWVAEHHALGSLANPAPEVLIGHLASATSTIRLGSGGMLLPNHRPIHVAEQFRVLESLHPGRIDLGIGRSEGALDPAIVTAFGRDEDSTHAGGFQTQLDHLLAFGGVRPLPPEDPMAGVAATPTDVPLPPVTLLGSSLSSARTAARLGLAYGFASHTNVDEAAHALRTYRAEFVPHPDRAEPHAMLALKVVVGEDDEHAQQLAAPWNLAMWQLRAGITAPFPTVADALAHTLTTEELAAQDRVDLRSDAVGSAATVARELERQVQEAQADEVIALTNTSAFADRVASYERLAAAVGLGSVPRTPTLR